jgi:PAS domain S-box-containing protein
MGNQITNSSGWLERAWKQVRKITHFPLLPEDLHQQDTLIMDTLTTLILIIGIISILITPFIYTIPSRGLILTASIIIMVLVIKILTSRGHLTLASRLFVHAIWGIDTIIIILSGGFTSIYLPSYVTITVMGGLLLGRKYTYHLAGLSVAAYLAFFVLDSLGLKFDPVISFNALAIIMIFCANLLLAALVLVLVLGKYDHSLLLLTQKEETLTQTNLMLKEENAAREEAETLLRLSENRFKSALMDSPYPTMLITSDGELITANTAWQQKSGYTAEEIAHLDRWMENFFRDQTPRFERMIRDISGQGDPQKEGFFTFYTRQGTTKTWYFRFALLPEAPDGKKLVMLVALDQTGLIEAESALRKSEETITLFSLITNDGIWDWDLRTDRVDFDPRYYTMSGYEVDEFPHQLEEFKKRVHPDDLERVFRNAEEHLSGAVDHFSVEFRFLTKEGGWLWVLGRGKIVEQDENGNPLRFVGTHTDISARKRAEEELNQYQHQLEAIVEDRTQKLEERIAEGEKLNAALSNILDDYQIANEKLSILSKNLSDTYQELESLTYTISNDLRNPLGDLKGIAEKLHRGYKSKLGPRGAKSLEQIQLNATRMDQLIKDLLGLAELSKRELKLADVDPNQLVREVLDNFTQEIEQRHIKVNLKDLPGCRADRELLRLVFQNLISNAVKFTSMEPNAEITIGYQPDQSNQRVTYFVMDNGIGFHMMDHERVFETFQRLHDQEIFRGTGIGLAMAKRIINRHGGEIWAEGKKNKGATFFFDLHSPGKDV